MTKRKYSDELIAQVVELRERGLTCRQIAIKTGMPEPSVTWHCLRLGADSPRTRRNTAPARQPMQYVRNGRVVRRFTPEEDRRLLEMAVTGMRLSQMGRELGRTHNTVQGRLMELARREARAEEAR